MRASLLAACALSIAPALAALPAADIPAEYDLEPETATSAFEYRATNAAHGFEAVFAGGNIRVVPLEKSAWTLEVDVPRLDRALAGARGARIDYAPSGPIESWAVNSGEGLVQGFLLLHPPSGAAPFGPFSIVIALRGDLSPKLDPDRGQALDLYHDGVRVLRYGVLRATDARGNDLPVHLETDGASSRLALVLERGGAFPLTVETVLKSAKDGRRLALSEAGAWDAAPHPEVAPANDLCAGALTIPAGGPFPYATPTADITDATSTGDPVARPTCVFPTEAVTRSVWYQITPSQAGVYTFSTCHGAATCLGDSGTTVDDTLMAVYTSAAGCAGPFTQVQGACDDDGCDQQPFQSFLTTTLEVGTTYYLVVWNSGPDPAVGHRSLRVIVDRPGAPPANDTCAGAQTIPALGPFPYRTPLAADITDATSTGDPPTPTCLGSGFAATRSTWYAFTPSATATYRISSCASDGEAGSMTTVDDTLIALYTSAGGCSGPFSEVPTSATTDGCDDDTCGVENLQAVINTPLSGGTTYYVVVYKVGQANPGCDASVRLFVAPVVPPANDRCTSAVPVALDAPVEGTTEFASDDYRAPATTACFSGVGQPTATSIATTGSDAVYRFIAPSTDLYSFKVTGYAPARNLVLYVGGDCPTLTPPATVACLAGANRNSSVSSEEVACLSLSAGKTAWVYVDDAGVTGGSPFTLEVNRCARETESNGGPQVANAFVCGIEGTIAPTGDTDYYSVGTPATGSRLFALVDGVAGNTSDLDLRVTTDADTLEYDDLDADVRFGPLAPTCDGTPLTGVASYLRVNAFNPQSIEPYRLYAVVQPPIAAAVAETEPNDSADRANDSPSGYFSGALSGTSPSTDVDVYLFQAAAGALLFVGLDGDPLRNLTPLDATLTLVDSSGTILFTVDDGDGSSNTTAGTGNLVAFTPRSPGEALVWRARSTGTYYAMVAARQGPGTTPRAGDYLLSISTGCVSVPQDPDGDGVATAADCAPSDPGVFAIPGEATALTLGPDTATLSWIAAGGGLANRHDVLRGRIAALPVGPGAGEEICFDDLPGTTLSDPTNPSTDDGFWFLVRGVNACGIGPYGVEGQNGAAGPARTSTTCP